jgi:predicted protein tyrosine phosphatase
LNLTISSIPLARKLLSEPKNHFDAFVSITDPGYGSLLVDDRFGKFYLKQEYNDIDPDFEKHFGFSVYSTIEDKVLPSKEKVKELIDFFQFVLSSFSNPSILIHCHQGVSRSTASGLIAFYLCYKNESLAAEKLLEIRPQAMPNGSVIRYADEILGTNLFLYSKEITENRIVLYQNILWGHT